MSYLVFCIFDLKKASREDYLYAYADLAKLGMKKIVKSDDGGNVTVPSTAVVGRFDGKSINDVLSTVGHQVEDVFKARGYSGEFFVLVSTGSAWGHGTT